MTADRGGRRRTEGTDGGPTAERRGTNRGQGGRQTSGQTADIVITDPAPEYGYSGAGPSARRSLEGMLWSDPPDEPPEETRQALAMLRRALVLIGLCLPALMLITGVRG